MLWLLEELGMTYEIARYQRQPDMRAPKELRAIHPLGMRAVRIARHDIENLVDRWQNRDGPHVDQHP